MEIKNMISMEMQSAFGPKRSDFPEFLPGTVWLAGAGPGDKNLVSLITYHALQNADVVLYDALVNTEILEWSNPEAIIEFVGKRKGIPSMPQIEISKKLVDFAKQDTEFNINP